MTNRCQFVVLLIGMCASALTAQGGEPDVHPKALLCDALKRARDLPKGSGYGDWRGTLLLLRIGETMRLHGLRDDAAGALAACREANASSQFPDEVKNEIAAELCRDLTLLGDTAQARRIAKDLKSRSYSGAAWLLIARSLQEAGKADEAEGVIREFLAAMPPEARKDRDNNLWTHGLAELALRMKRPELARSLADSIQSEPWKTGALADIATDLARAGRTDEALKIAGGFSDSFMAASGWARLAAVFAATSSAAPTATALDGLNLAAAKIKTDPERDFALRLAARRLAAAGAGKEAARLAGTVKDPCAAALAQCDLFAVETFDATADAVARCPEGDRDLLWEAMAVMAGRKGMAEQAAKASDRIASAWAGLRARRAVAGELADAGNIGAARQALDAATGLAGKLDAPGWRCCAHIGLAMGYGRIGAKEATDEQLDKAKNEIAQVQEVEAREALLTRLARAMAALDRKPSAKALLTETLQASPRPSLRDALVVLLAEAGETEAALAEQARARLTATLFRRMFMYRVAQSGNPRRALDCMAGLAPIDQAEALADVARARLRSPSPAPWEEKAVGVTLHGGWRAWFPRLERMGVRWELMPFLEPYEAEAEGLRSKYIALGFPGTGDHFAHLSTVGIEHVREYIYSGGGFMGICAGQYLATKGEYVTCDAHGFRGRGPHQVQMRKHHLVSLGLPPVIIISRMNGGMLLPGPGCEVLGWYDKVDRYAALVAEQYGRGRVVAFSPHPEGSSDLVPGDLLCINALNWAMTGLP